MKEVIGGPIVLADGSVVPLSKALRVGDWVLVSGQLAFDASGRVIDGSITEQTTQVLSNIREILEQAGCTLSDVVRCTCWLADLNDFKEFNAAYAAFFPDQPPVRSTVRADLMFNAKIEIEVTAHKPIL